VGWDIGRKAEKPTGLPMSMETASKFCMSRQFQCMPAWVGLKLNMIRFSH
jgi:hypothetical protein